MNELDKMINKAHELESRKLYRRAITMWGNIMSYSDSEHLYMLSSRNIRKIKRKLPSSGDSYEKRMALNCKLQSTSMLL